MCFGIIRKFFIKISKSNHLSFIKNQTKRRFTQRILKQIAFEKVPIIDTTQSNGVSSFTLKYNYLFNFPDRLSHHKPFRQFKKAKKKKRQNNEKRISINHFSL